MELVVASWALLLSTHIDDIVPERLALTTDYLNMLERIRVD